MSNIERVAEYLNKTYPVVTPELTFENDFQMLVAVILSAQCTDKRVNIVTSKIFPFYKTPADFLKLTQTQLEQMIYSTGFYHNKAKNILALCKVLVEEYDSKLPLTAAELEKLPGVGRKTANVVASFLYNEQKIGVDTHVLRVTNRLGLVNAKTPLEVERQWIKKYPNYLNHDMHFRLVLFGRYHCKAQKPNCTECALKDICKFYKQKQKEVNKNVC